MTDPPRNLVFLAGFAVYIGIRHVYGKRAAGTEKTVRRMGRLEIALLAVVMLGSLLLPALYLTSSWLSLTWLSFADYELPVETFWLGSLVMVAALWLFWRSHQHLGANWSISLETRRDHVLITHGVYRWIRHPMYASIWSWSLAQALLLENWLAGWSALVTFAPLYFVRTPREERLMCDVFGEDYQRYMRRTGRLLPRLGARGPAVDGVRPR